MVLKISSKLDIAFGFGEPTCWDGKGKVVEIEIISRESRHQKSEDPGLPSCQVFLAVSWSLSFPICKQRRQHASVSVHVLCTPRALWLLGSFPCT